MAKFHNLSLRTKVKIGLTVYTAAVFFLVLIINASLLGTRTVLAAGGVIGDPCDPYDNIQSCQPNLVCYNCSGGRHACGGSSNGSSLTSDQLARIACNSPGSNPSTPPGSECTPFTWKCDKDHGGSGVGGYQCTDDGHWSTQHVNHVDACGYTEDWVMGTTNRTYDFVGCGDLFPSASGAAGNPCANCYEESGAIVCRLEGSSCGAREVCFQAASSSSAAPAAAVPTPTSTATPPAETPPYTPPVNPPQDEDIPGLDVTKSAMAGTIFVSGDLVPFQVVITNTGETTFTSVIFQDFFNPTYLSYTGVITGFKTGSAPMSLAGITSVMPTGLLQISNLAASSALGPLAPGQSYTIDIQFIANAPITITCNDAYVTTSGLTEWDDACVGIIPPNTDL